MNIACSSLPEFSRQNDLEHDGQRINPGRDPPGQHSVYIPPGDSWKETYRLSTFKDFPSDAPPDPLQLARCGFFYTGYRDRVKCFSCGQNVENWLLEDEISDPGWHHESCQYVCGTDTTNIPINTGFLFQNRQSRQNTSAPHANLSILNNAVISSGISNSVSSSNPIQRRTTSGNFNPGRRNETERTSFEIPQNNIERSFTYASVFPCRNAINPHMRSKESRMQTFADNILNWPADRIQATPEEITDAGLFYLGERDRVKCWYCNGGLQNWERDDSPWEEHAKWFPMCEYVLQQKGPEFVHRIVSSFPGLRRPSLYNPSTSLSARGILREIHQRPSDTSYFASSRAPEIVDPREELRERKRKVNEDMMSSLVSQVKDLGFEDRVIRHALRRNYERGRNKLTKIHELVEIILNIPDDDVASEMSDEEETNLPETPSASRRSPREQLSLLEESRRCRSCRQEEACVVFIPCGHLPCCVTCSDGIFRCPICRETAREKVRSYIS